MATTMGKSVVAWPAPAMGKSVVAWPTPTEAAVVVPVAWPEPTAGVGAIAVNPRAPPPSAAESGAHGPHEVRRVCTVRGAQMALAMLRGQKSGENRGRRWQAGWYNLHVGKQDLRQACVGPLSRTWPDAPDASALPRSCIVGQIRLGPAALAEGVDDPWALPSVG